MTIKYTWSINNIKTKKDDKGEDIVAEIYWRKTGKDEKGNEGFFDGLVLAENIVTNSEEVSKFIPYNKLREADVLKWVKKAVSGVDEHVDRNIIKQIDEKNNVLVDTPLPWVKSQKTSK